MKVILFLPMILNFCVALSPYSKNQNAIQNYLNSAVVEIPLKSRIQNPQHLSMSNTDVSSREEGRQESGIHIYPGSPIYDSLLTRRTYVPSLRMILLELSLMTISVFVFNAFENMMAAQKGNRKLAYHHSRHLFENL